MVLAVMAERYEITRHRCEEAGVKPKLQRPSPTFNFTKEVKNICKTYNVDQAEKMLLLKNLLGRHALIQAESETCSARENIFETLSNKVEYQ